MLKSRWLVYSIPRMSLPRARSPQVSTEQQMQRNGLDTMRLGPRSPSHPTLAAGCLQCDTCDFPSSLCLGPRLRNSGVPTLPCTCPHQATCLYVS